MGVFYPSLFFRCEAEHNKIKSLNLEKCISFRFFALSRILCVSNVIILIFLSFFPCTLKSLCMYFHTLDNVLQCRVLLNLRTSQPFEEVVEDLGQVLKMTAAKRMYAVGGQEIRSFSQLRNEFADVDTFYLSSGGAGTGAPGSPLRRSRSRAGLAAAAGGAGGDDPVRGTAKQRARSKSRPRILYAPDNEVVRAGPGECKSKVHKNQISPNTCFLVPF